MNKLLIVSFHSYTQFFFHFCSSEEKRVYLDCTRFNFGFCLQRVDARIQFSHAHFITFATFSVSPFGSSQMEHKFKEEHFEKPNIFKIGIPCLFVICRSFRAITVSPILSFTLRLMLSVCSYRLFFFFIDFSFISDQVQKCYSFFLPNFNQFDKMHASMFDPRSNAIVPRLFLSLSFTLSCCLLSDSFGLCLLPSIMCPVRICIHKNIALLRFSCCDRSVPPSSFLFFLSLSLSLTMLCLRKTLFF